MGGDQGPSRRFFWPQISRGQGAAPQTRSAIGGQHFLQVGKGLFVHPLDAVLFGKGQLNVATAAAAEKIFGTVVEAKSPSVEAVIQSVNHYFETNPES